MDREEILEKSRRENLVRDEGAQDARNKGMQWGVAGFLFLCVAVLAYNLARGLDGSLPVAFLLGYIGCEASGAMAPGGRSPCSPPGYWEPWVRSARSHCMWRTLCERGAGSGRQAGIEKPS